MLNYIRENAVRVQALVVAVLALVAKYVPGLPTDEILVILVAALALIGGEVAQRVENRKTSDADAFAYAEGLSVNVASSEADETV